MMKEAEIRPAALFNQYLELSRQDAASLLAGRTHFLDSLCPACGGAGTKMFLKWGYEYHQCGICGSLFLGLRPTAEQLDQFYATAASVLFWSTDFYKQTAEARREKMFRPRAAQLCQLADTNAVPSSATVVDIGSGYGLFLEELRGTARFATVTGIEPSASLASVCRAQGFITHEFRLEAMPEALCTADLACAFEVLEHVLDPLAFLQGVRRLLSPGGLAVMTTLTVDGFDIQTLWENSRSIYPPHHINLLSIDGYRRLLARADLELVEISTPGKLDIDIVANALRDIPDLPVDRFARRLALAASPPVREAFQAFLQENHLSSHLRIIAKRRHD